MHLTRRFFVVALAVSGGLSTMTLGALRPEGAAVRRLRRLLPHSDSALAVGAIYRRTVAAEADTTTLARRLLSSLSLDASRLDGQSESALRARVAALVREDFAARRTVTIDGWILSRTEARLCALWA